MLRSSPKVFEEQIQAILRSTSTEDYQFLLNDTAEIVQQISKERIAQEEVPPKCLALENLIKEIRGEAILIICQNEATKRLVEKICKFGAKGIDQKDSLEKETGEEVTEGVSERVVTFLEFEQEELEGFKAIIIYDICLAVVRTIELFLAKANGAPQPEIYHIVYADSFEEQKYLREIREEKMAFERLIAKKGTIIFPDVLLQIEEKKKEESKNDLENELLGNLDERGLKRGSSTPKQVIIDMRELKSHLPFILHRNGFLIEPQTITVGDYILPNMIAIERKSVSDFVQSLENGRLADQAAAITERFQRAALLIEFERGRPFQLQTTHYLKSGIISVTEVSSRLVLLLLHYPKLRILWSSSPLNTVHIFSDLVASIELEENGIHPLESKNKSGGGTINRSAKEALLALPGVTEKNVLILMREFKNLRSILTANRRELERAISPESATLLYEFLQSSK